MKASHGHHLLLLRNGSALNHTCRILSRSFASRIIKDGTVRSCGRRTVHHRLTLGSLAALWLTRLCRPANFSPISSRTIPHLFDLHEQVVERCLHGCADRILV